MQETLMERTLELLKSSDKTLPEIYADLRATGSDVTFFWLRKFSSGGVKDPSVNRVECLYNYLSEQPFVSSR